MNTIRKLFKRRVHALPIDNGLFADTFIVVQLNAFQVFFDNWRRYGWQVAVYNFRALLRD